MNRSWKIFTVVISVMICVAVLCTAWNIALDKLTKSVDSTSGNQGYVDQNGDENPSAGNQGTGQTGTNVTNANGQVVTQPGGSTVINPNSQGSNTVTPSGSAQQSSAVLNYDKAQIIAYYNTCLRNSYSQAKMTDKKTEKVTIGVDSVTINGGETNKTITSIANKLASSNQKATEDSKTFSRGVASDGTSASKFVLPANLTANGAKRASISKNGAGYKVVITLVAESCNYNTMPPHNAACAWPLDVSEVTKALNGFADITAATFAYPGTTLTATIDGAGRVNSVRVDMPLTVSNGTGVVTAAVFKGTTITASAHGEWVCTHSMSF